MDAKIDESLKKNKSVLQFSKFFVVGILNTGIDFLILNSLMWFTHIYSGTSIIIFGTISFSVAVANSYFLNKYWTFEDKTAVKDPAQFAKFFTVSVIGWLLNTAILFSITTYIHPILGLSAALWANFAKVVATGVVLAWNFAGYKLFVFKK